MRALASLVSAGLLLGAGCADAEDPGTETPSASSYQDPGSDIGFGLVVPEGTRLIGRPFGGPPEDGSGAITAMLEVVRDPFGVWADLVDQAASSLGIALPSSGVCQWRSENSAEDQRNIIEPRPPGAFAVDCEGFAVGLLPDGSGTLHTSMRLWWEETGSELSIQLEPRAGELETSPYPLFDPGAVPNDMSALLPPVERDLPGVGEPFGQEENCFETGYTRFRVPEGTRFLGGGMNGMALVGVLEVDDPEAVVRDLLDQLEGGDGQDQGEYELEHRDGPDGGSWILEGHIPAGGGSCTIWSTPDERLVVVTAHSD